MIAIAATAVVPVAKHAGLRRRHRADRAVAIIGAFVFGIGMQLGNGCGSGTLYGRQRLRSHDHHAGVLHPQRRDRQPAPAFLQLGGIDPILAADYLGLGQAHRHLGDARARVLGGIVLARKRGAAFKPSRKIMIGAVLIGLLSISVFAAGHHPWSVTFGFTVWGAKLAALAGFDLSGAEFWQWAGPKHALGDLILGDTSSLTNLGMIFGAMAAAAATRRSRATLAADRLAPRGRSADC